MENNVAVIPEVTPAPSVPAVLKFYNFNQNNPGGTTEIDKVKGIGGLVIIQASSIEDANRRALDIGIYFDGVAKGYDCECCGDRWHELSSWNEGEATDQPMYMDTPINQAVHGVWSRTAAVHYADGLMKFYDAREPDSSRLSH